MQWKIERETPTVRVSVKTYNGERVERVERYGLSHTSMFGRNAATGAYARHRWYTAYFKCLDEVFVTWSDVVEFINDTDAVSRAKAALTSKTQAP